MPYKTVTAAFITLILICSAYTAQASETATLAANTGVSTHVAAPPPPATVGTPPMRAHENIIGAYSAGATKNYAANPQIQPNPATQQPGSPSVINPVRPLSPCNIPYPMYPCTP